MDSDHCVKCIVEGMELYLRTLALADNMNYQAGDIEWIAPKPNAVGPAVVFKIALDEMTAAQRIDELIPHIKLGVIPSFWFISPTSTPKNIIQLLTEKGFQDGSDPEKPELGMALDMEMISEWPVSNPSVKVKKVQASSEFASWIEVVNKALHGWDMLDTEHCFPLVSRDGVSFYLASLNHVPIATAATIQDGDTASIEFVSTLKDYRHLGAATAVCVEALRELQKKGVQTVTLRASNEAIPLYTKLGFKPYFETTAMSYQINQGATGSISSYMIEPTS